MKNRLVPLGVTVLTLAYGVSCGGGDSGTGPDVPDPGMVDLVLDTPHTNDGALLVTVSGGNVTAVAGQAYQVAARGVGSSSVRLMVRGSITDGPIARLTIPDRRKRGQYTILVTTAAARTTYEQLSVSNYTLRLEPVP